MDWKENNVCLITKFDRKKEAFNKYLKSNYKKAMKHF